MKRYQVVLSAFVLLFSISNARAYSAGEFVGDSSTFIPFTNAGTQAEYGAITYAEVTNIWRDVYNDDSNKDGYAGSAGHDHWVQGTASDGDRYWGVSTTDSGQTGGLVAVINSDGSAYESSYTAGPNGLQCQCNFTNNGYYFNGSRENSCYGDCAL